MNKIIKLAKEHFKNAEEGWADNRKEALDDIRFARLGEQWPDDVKTQRERQSRPCLTINRLPAFIRQVVNDARLNSPSIKVHPVDDFADVETADIIDGIIRNIEANSGADVAYDNALESAVTCGMGFFRIDVDYADNEVFEKDIRIERIANPLSVYFDPFSMAVDGSDWSYCFIVDTMTHEAFKEAYPNADLDDWEADDQEGWLTRETVRVAEYWRREEVTVELLLLSNGITITQDKYLESQDLFDASGLTIVKSRPTKTHKVTQYLMTGSEILEETEWAGTYIPIIPVFGDEIVVEDKRYFQSLVRQSKDAQRNYNYWRTASTERVALATKAPWIGPVGFADTDSRKWESANSESHPFIEYDGPVAPQQTPPSMADAGSITEALNASDDLKNIMGIHDASLGARSNETSGKAIMARQREGDVSTFHFIDNLSRGIRYAGKILLELIPRVYNTPRIIRVLGLDGSPDNVKINQEYLVNNVPKLHDLTKGKYDLTVDTGPSFSTQREEAATQMTEMLRTFPQAAPIIGDLVAKNLDWPGADEIAKRLKTLLPPEIQAMEKMDGLPPEAQAAIAQSQQQLKQLQQLIEQGKQMLKEKDEQIKLLELERKSKQDELAIKNIESQRKYDAEMAKIQSNQEMLMYKEREENRRAIIDEASSYLQSHLENTKRYNEDFISHSMAQLEEILNQVPNMIPVDEPKRKEIEVISPSGGVYRGVVTEQGQLEISAPSGAEYQGSITEK